MASGTVVITGASTGIGRACALHLDSIGFDVFAGVRKAEDAEQVRAEGSERLRPLLLDVTDTGQIEAAAREVTAAVGDRGLAGLVNNAGIAVAAPLEFFPIDELRRQLEVNLIGQVAITQALLPLLRGARGRVVNIGSIGGRVAAPFMGAYAASKFALEGLTDSLRRELRGTGVQVSIVRPGGIATPIWDRGLDTADRLRAELPPEAESLYGHALDATKSVAAEIGRNGLPPEAVATVVEHALTARRPKTRYIVGRDAKIRAALAKVLPDRVFDRMIARAMGI